MNLDLHKNGITKNKKMTEKINKSIKDFSLNIGYEFSDENLLLEALTHPSYVKTHRHAKNYQRLEFLGDKVLSLVISQYLMARYAQENEGDLSKRHAALVSGSALAQIALDVGIEHVLRLSVGEKNLGGKTNKRNLENALEALIGAIYVDSNYENAQKFIFKFWQKFLDENLTPPKDPVSQLQEIVQTKSKQLPKYEIIKTSGSEHSPTFTARLTIPYLEKTFEAEGKSKKEAQKEAAVVALKKILS